MSAPQSRSTTGNPVTLIIRVHPQQHPIPLRGRTAQVAYMLLQQRDKPHSALEMSLRLDPPASTAQAGQAAVHEAIAQLRKLAPSLIYKAGWGKGWRIASDVSVEQVWKDPKLFMPLPKLNNPYQRPA